jgi:hypothetical protein
VIIRTRDTLTERTFVVGVLFVGGVLMIEIIVPFDPAPF